METPNHEQLMNLCSCIVAAHGGVDSASRTLDLPSGTIHRALTVASPDLEWVLLRIAEEIGDRTVIPERRFAVLRRDAPTQ